MTRLLASLAACAMLLTVSMARGVQLSANGQGQVLIYPYYTVRDAPDTGTPFNTLVSVVNGTLEGKVVRVRFREARRGAPVFEANVFLSPRDVWTAAVIPWQGGAALVSTDNTCTQPSIKMASGSPPSAVFYPDRYLTDGGGTTIGRTRDGYIEVLEMGTVRNPSALYSATVHILGVASCLLPGQEQIPSNLDPPSGGLYGTGTLINVLEGAAYAYDAVALERWSAVQTYTVPGDGSPSLADANPFDSTVIAGRFAYLSRWNSGLDAVSAALMTSRVEAEFMREPQVLGATDIVMTFPTWPLAHPAAGPIRPFRAPSPVNAPCEFGTDASFGRDEQVFSAQDGFNTVQTAFCWASNVFSMEATYPAPSSVVGGTTGQQFIDSRGNPFASPPTAYAAGVTAYSLGTYVDNSLTAIGDSSVIDLGSGLTTIVPGLKYVGLPIIGVSLVRFVNGTIASPSGPVLSTYGAVSALRTVRTLSFP